MLNKLYHFLHIKRRKQRERNGIEPLVLFYCCILSLNQILYNKKQNEVVSNKTFEKAMHFYTLNDINKRTRIFNYYVHSTI